MIASVALLNMVDQSLPNYKPLLSDSSYQNVQPYFFLTFTDEDVFEKSWLIIVDRQQFIFTQLDRLVHQCIELIFCQYAFVDRRNFYSRFCKRLPVASFSTLASEYHIAASFLFLVAQSRKYFNYLFQFDFWCAILMVVIKGVTTKKHFSQSR